MNRNLYKLRKQHPGEGVAVTDKCHTQYYGHCRCGGPCMVCGWPKHCALHMPGYKDTSGRPWDHEYMPPNAGGERRAD